MTSPTPDPPMSVAALEPKVRAILGAPGVDLQTISAKRVRRQLAEDTSIPAGFVRAHKSQVDDLITSVFVQMCEQAGVQLEAADEDEDEDDAPPAKRRREAAAEVEQDEEAEDGEEEVPVKAPPKKKTKKQVDADEEFARKISNELNGRTSRATARGAKANGTKSAKRRKVKSAAEVSDGEEGDEQTKPKRKGGFSKEYILSEPLAALLQTETMSRPQVVKGLWNHIRANDLQNPSDKRQIMCDDAFRAIFKVNKMGMFEMNKLLGQHLTEPSS